MVGVVGERAKPRRAIKNESYRERSSTRAGLGVMQLRRSSLRLPPHFHHPNISLSSLDIVLKQVAHIVDIFSTRFNPQCLRLGAPSTAWTSQARMPQQRCDFTTLSLSTGADVSTRSVEGTATMTREDPPLSLRIN